MKVSGIVDRFYRETRLRFKEGATTGPDYARVFRRFAEAAHLEDRTKQALAGKLGRILLIDYLSTVGPASRRHDNAALKSVWTCGLGLAYPIDSRRDFGNAPPVNRRRTPRDEAVRPWAEAVRQEKEPYLRAFVLCELQYGWRPVNQLSRLRWRHVRYRDGRPSYIEADGTEAGFKSASPIVAWLPEDVGIALEDLRAVMRTAEDEPIFPWRSARGEIRRAAIGTKETAEATWRTFRRKHDLPKLRPVDLRHFVKTGLRRLGLSDPASAAWQGHKATEGGMRAVYDNPEAEALIAEQSARAPRGPLELIEPPVVRADEALPPEAVRIVSDLLAGKLSDLEAASALGRLRVALAQKQPSMEG